MYRVTYIDDDLATGCKEFDSAIEALAFENDVLEAGYTVSTDLIKFEAYINNTTGDVIFKIDREEYFDFIDLWDTVEDFWITSEDREVTTAEGMLTLEEFAELEQANKGEEQ